MRILSTKEGQRGILDVALTDTIYDLREGEVVFRRHTVRLTRRIRGGAVIYVITVFVLLAVVPVEHSLFLKKFRLTMTPDQPAKGCEVGSGTKNESISVYGRPAAA